jgi:hypothetical protein
MEPMTAKATDSDAPPTAEPAGDPLSTLPGRGMAFAVAPVPTSAGDLLVPIQEKWRFGFERGVGGPPTLTGVLPV